MDLAAEIANLKRKAADGPDPASASSSKKKYQTKGDLERQRKLDEEAEDRRKAAEHQRQRNEKVALAAKLARDPKAKKVSPPGRPVALSPPVLPSWRAPDWTQELTSASTPPPLSSLSCSRCSRSRRPSPRRRPTQRRPPRPRRRRRLRSTTRPRPT